MYYVASVAPLGEATQTLYPTQEEARTAVMTSLDELADQFPDHAAELMWAWAACRVAKRTFCTWLTLGGTEYMVWFQPVHDVT